MAVDLVKVAAPDGRVREVDGVSGHRYRSRDGMYEMAPRDAAALLKVGGFLPNLGGQVRGGYRCSACGFGSFFRRCKCGAECVKE
jgi:hypothetical protein